MVRDALIFKLIELAHYGKARCGWGFGKYPLGIRDAIDQLQSLIPKDSQNRDLLDFAIEEFDERLKT